MLYILCLIMLTFFAVIGLLTFINAIVLGLSSKNDDMNIILPSLTGSDAEHRVRKAVYICEEIGCRRLICKCADDEARLICSKLKASYPVIEIV